MALGHNHASYFSDIYYTGYNYKLVCIQDMTLVLTKNSIFLSLASFDQKLWQCAGGQSKKYSVQAE